MTSETDIVNTTLQLQSVNFNDPGVVREKTRLLYANSMLLDVATIVLVSLIVLVSNSYSNSTELQIWAGSLIVVCIYRMLASFSFKRKKDKHEKISLWRNNYIVSSLLLAVGCGLSALLFYTDTDLTLQVMLCFFISGYCAVALISLSSMNLLSISFVAITLLPFAWQMIHMPEFVSVMLGLAVTSLFISMFYMANQNSRFLLSLISLSFQHKQLINDLTDIKETVEKKNKTLNHEVERHKKTEAELRQAMERAEEAARIKSEFLATMSHEIRTPMNGVLGMTELLTNTQLSIKQNRFAEAIRQSGEALLAIINDILDFSKIEAGKFELKQEAFDLRNLLEETTELFAERAAKKEVELACIYPVNAHTAYCQDASRIRQVLNNLIGNAIKFTENGEIVIKTGIEDVDTEHSKIKVEVADSGIGIKQEALSKIFDSFTQADGSMNRRFGGTGLGLAICKKLIEMMQGKIGVNSQEGEGSVFWFSLTMKKEAVEKVRDKKTQMNGSIAGARVLVIDANEISQEVLRTQIQGHGALFEIAKTAKQGLHQLLMAKEDKKPFDIVIIDKMLPSLDGIQLAKKIKANPIISDSKIIILSSVGQLEETGEWMMAGVRAYLNKPLRQTELFNCLCRVLNDKEEASKSNNKALINNANSLDYTLSGHILVAEDNLINQELIKTMLDNYGCRYKFFDNGREAVEALTDAPLDNITDPYDLILMDCQMPEQDGYEATKLIRAWENNNQETPLPIIALTANAMQGDREKCLQAGMDDYLSKPFTNDQFFSILKKWLPVLAEKTGSQTANSQQKSLPEPEESTHVTQLDQNALNKVRNLQTEGSADVLLKIIDIYLEKGPDLMQQIEDAVSTGNADKLRHAAHSLKSSSASLGAKTLATLCSELELMGKENNMEPSMNKLDFLEFEFEAVCRALQQEYDKQAA